MSLRLRPEAIYEGAPHTREGYQGALQAMTSFLPIDFELWAGEEIKDRHRA